MKRYISLILYLLMYRNNVMCAYTKPMKLVGLPSGQILQCQMDKLDICTVFVDAKAPISSVAISGEYIFAGLGNGQMWRCEVNSKQCEIINQAGSSINAVVPFGDNLFAGTNGGTLWKCGLLSKHSCVTISVSEKGVKSIAVAGDYIYVGLETAVMWRCRVDLPQSCVTFNQGGTPINALAISGKFVYAGLGSGTLWACSLFTEHSCETIYRANSNITAIDVFEENLHVALETGVILRCGIINRDCWVLHDRKSKVLSLANVYATTKLRAPFVGENSKCSWQDLSHCPPYVSYFNIEQRAALELQVKNRRIYTSVGKIYDTSNADRSYTGHKAIFVMEPGGRIYTTNVHPSYLIHHSSLVSGNPVAAAGEIVVKNGIIKSVTNCAGQYRSTIELTQQIRSSLEIKGYERNITIEDCKDLPIELDIDFNITED